MATVIPQRDLRNRNAQIIERVGAGESFVVARDGAPVADLTPHVPSRRPPRFRSAEDASTRTRLSSAEAEAWIAETHQLREVLDHAQDDPWRRGARNE